MPYVPRFNPGELQAIAQKMIEYPPEQVERDYRLGKIGLNSKLWFLRQYGDAQRDIAVIGVTAQKVAKDEAVAKQGGGATGEFNVWFSTVVKEFKAAYDAAVTHNDLSDVVTGKNKPADPGKAIFHALAGSMEILRGLDVPGDAAERKVLALFPDSPGFARAVNWAVWGTLNFYGVSTVLKAPFKAAEATIKAGGKVNAEIAEYMRFVKDPVGTVLKQSKAMDAAQMVQLAKAEAENKVLKNATAANAAIAGEAKGGGNQAFTIADPTIGGAPSTPAPAPILAHIASPQELEAMMVKELIAGHEQRMIDQVRSRSVGGPGVSHGQTRAAAAANPMSFADIIARSVDAPVSDTIIESMRPLHEQVMTSFNAILDQVVLHNQAVSAGTRPDLVQAYKAYYAAAEITNPAFMSARGQAGRATNYLGTVQELVHESKVFDTVTRSLASEKFLQGSDQAIAYAARKVYMLGKAERAKLIGEASKSDTSTGTMRIFYKSLLFARPGIHVANMLGNLSSAMIHGVNKTAAAAVPFNDTSWKEAVAYWSGMWETRKSYLDLWHKAQANQARSLSKAGIEGTATGNVVKYGPLGWLGFEDEYAAGVVEHGLAKSQAVKEGLSKWDELQDAVKLGFQAPPGTNKNTWLGDYVDSVMHDPRNYERLTEEIQKEADRIIFRSPLSKGGEDIARGIRTMKLDYIMPVIKFPINALKMGRDWTPGLQMLSKEFVESLAEGGARADAARARMTISWMVSSQVYEAAKAGTMTGGGPLNQRANAVWQAAGNTPYAINGTPIKWFEPFGTWFGIIADAAQASNEMHIDDLGDLVTAAVITGYRAVESNYWLRVMQGVTNVVSDIKGVADLNDIIGAAAKVVGQPIKTMIGLGTPGRVVGEMINPESPDLRFYGELDDLRNWTFASTPWGANSRPRLDYSGNKKLVPPVLGSQWVQENLGAPDWVARGMAMFMPPVRSNLGEDKVAQFMDRHGISVHDNWKYYGGSTDIDTELPIIGGTPRVSLTGDQAYDWKFLALNDARQYGTDRNWRDTIDALDSDQRFLRMDRNQKQAELNRTYAEFRKTGLDMLKRVNPDVLAKEKERDALVAEQKNLPQMSGGLAEEPNSTPPSDGILRGEITKSFDELQRATEETQ